MSSRSRAGIAVLLVSVAIDACTRSASPPEGTAVNDAPATGSPSADELGFVPVGRKVRVDEIVLTVPEGTQMRREEAPDGEYVMLRLQRSVAIVRTGPAPRDGRFFGCPRPAPEPQTDEAPVLTCRTVRSGGVGWTRITTRNGLEFRTIVRGTLYRLIGDEGDEPMFRRARFEVGPPL